MPATIPLPNELSHLEAYTWQAITLGCSSAQVYRLDAPDARPLFLKTAPVNAADEVRGEAERLVWLQGKLPVPEVVRYLEDATGTFLVTTAVRGKDLTTFNCETSTVKRRVAQRLGHSLRLVHSLDIRSCPFDHSPARQFAQLHELLKRYETVKLRGETLAAGEALARLLAERPAQEELVFTHGDPCLPNVLFERGNLSGFIDLGSAGIGVRYRDLALARWSLNYNFGEGFTEAFFEAYGLPEPDEVKLTFYETLEHFLFALQHDQM